MSAKADLRYVVQCFACPQCCEYRYERFFPSHTKATSSAQHYVESVELVLRKISCISDSDAALSAALKLILSLAGSGPKSRDRVIGHSQLPMPVVCSSQV